MSRDVLFVESRLGKNVHIAFGIAWLDICPYVTRFGK